MSEPSCEGGCLCGDIRYRVTGRPRVQCYCCCATCRGATGAPAVAWIAIEDSRFTVLRGTPIRYQSSPGVWREFCGRCGTALTYRNPGYPDERFAARALVAITMASLDDIEAFPPDEVFHDDELPSWLPVDDLCGSARRRGKEKAHG